MASKTQSQRLRAVIFRLWEKDNRGRDSEEFYKWYMESIISVLKRQLEADHEAGKVFRGNDSRDTGL